MNKIVYLRKAAMDQITSLCDLNYRQKQEYDVYGAMTNITGDCVIDRTNYFWDYINTNSIYSRIPELYQSCPHHQRLQKRNRHKCNYRLSILRYRLVRCIRRTMSDEWV